MTVGHCSALATYQTGYGPRMFVYHGLLGPETAQTFPAANKHVQILACSWKPRGMSPKLGCPQIPKLLAG